MSTVRKTITLTRRQDDWIKAQIENGDCTNESEYIRDLIWREQERQLESPAEIAAIRAALIEGEQSGHCERSVCGSHAIYYRIRPMDVRIVRILGRQDGSGALPEA